MKIKYSLGEQVFNCFNILFMTFMIIVTLYPILYVLFAAFSEPVRFMGHLGMLWGPLGFTLTSLEAVFKNPNIISGYKNTIFIVVVGVGVNLFMTVLGAYFLSRKDVMLKSFFTLMIVFTMYFSGGLIPNYLLVRNLGLYGSFGALIIPGAISTFNLIIMRTAFAAIPDSLEESAKLDGANHLTILFRIMIPLAMPTVAVLVLYYGVSHWNSWFSASIYLRKREMYPLQLILREVIVQNDTNSMTTGAGTGDAEMLSETIKYAVIVVSTAPILFLYPFLQKYFVKGIMVGAVKG